MTTTTNGHKMRETRPNEAPKSSPGTGSRPLVCGLLLVLAGLACPLASALKVSVAIPELVKLNDAFWLNCSHTAHTQQLAAGGGLATDESPRAPSGPEIYAIKWYKDEEEFYRYLPNAEPKVSIYETNGIQLDSKSFQGNVFITKADVNSEGVYRCEILSEAPVFETVRKSKQLRVYALPVRGPKIEILDASGRPRHPKDKEFSYAVGDKIELRCSSAPSKPAARLRWYLNDHELAIPAPGANLSSQVELRQFVGGRPGANLQNYNVRVTPIEQRQHYKGIYSAHSTLSFVLQQNDLVNSRISFKCLASMRQEIPVQSKQLIVLTPQHQLQLASSAFASAAGGTSGARFRFKRLANLLLADELAADPSVGEQLAPRQHQQQRHRVQYNRRPAAASRAALHQQQQALDSNPIRELISSGQADELQLAYVHEEADSTLGPSVIDTPELLDKYLAEQQQSQQQLGGHPQADQPGAPALGLDFNRADNLDHVQALRDRVAKQRSLPQSPLGNLGQGLSKSQRLHSSINSIVRSPLYLDELDALRPIINWPPLESGRLMLLPPSNTVVAIATQQQQPQLQSQSEANQQGRGAELRFVLPPKADSPSRSSGDRQPGGQQRPVGQLILEKLVENLNCTCTEGSVDTRLQWLVNELSLAERDTRFFATRVSPDHRQTWLTIGLQASFAGGSSPAPTAAAPVAPLSALSRSSSGAVTLQSVLSQYYNKPAASEKLQQSRPPTGTQQPPATNEQIRFACQATHSMLLYSGSEMITFDFNPPPLNEIEAGSVDKFQSQPSNVIQATSASQSSSANSGHHYLTPKSMRSQQTTIGTLVALLLVTTTYSLWLALYGERLWPSGGLLGSKTSDAARQVGCK